jgi:acyl carrier protein
MTAIGTDEIGSAIETFIRGRFEVPEGDARFTRTVNLWEDGYVDSMGVVEVIEFLEQTFGVRIPETVLFSPDFTHIDGIARIVAGLQGAPHPIS